MAKSAQDRMNKIAADMDDMIKAAQDEIRRDVADQLMDMVKNGRDEDFAPFLDDETGITYKIGISAADFRVTDEFLAGVKFAINALKDKNFEL